MIILSMISFFEYVCIQLYNRPKTIINLIAKINDFYVSFFFCKIRIKYWFLRFEFNFESQYKIVGSIGFKNNDLFWFTSHEAIQNSGKDLSKTY